MKMKIIAISVILLLVMVGLSGCLKKSIYIGEFTSMEGKSRGKGTFVTVEGKTMTVYAYGSWEQIELNTKMKISVEYNFGYKLIDYDYLDDEQDEKTI